MTRLGTILHLAASATFVIAGLRHTAAITPLPHSQWPSLSGPLLPPPPQVGDAAAIFPQLYLDPANLVMWTLLIVVWLMVLLDAVGQSIDPSDEDMVREQRPRLWPLLTVALVVAASWPWMLDDLPLLTAGTALTATCAIVSAKRATGRHRPGVGFFAGWATALFSAALAGLAADKLTLPVQALSAFAILPAAGVGIAAQLWIGRSISYSAALIWCFCGLSITTMGSDPIIALTAVLGISGMAAVLVRAAS